MRISGGVVFGGMFLQHGLRDRGDLRIGDANVGAGLKEDLDDAEAVIGIGFDVLDVIDRRRQLALVGERCGPPCPAAASRYIARSPR